MIAWISPALIVSESPFRIGLSATVAWRFSILSIAVDPVFIGFNLDGTAIDHQGLVLRNCDKFVCAADLVMGVRDQFRVRTRYDRTPPEKVPQKHHPTLPSRLIPNRFCASTANSIGSCCNTSLARPLTISATASSCKRPRCIA